MAEDERPGFSHKRERHGLIGPFSGRQLLLGAVAIAIAATTAARARDADGGHARPRPDETWEILCNDVVLPLDMTLAAVRQFVWRQAAELTMHYRRKRQEPVPLGLSPNL